MNEFQIPLELHFGVQRFRFGRILEFNASALGVYRSPTLQLWGFFGRTDKAKALYSITNYTERGYILRAVFGNVGADLRVCPPHKSFARTSYIY
ncbi:MAG: hypothetical protein KAI83_08130 [Thiomargarita sp.]|nr:hypothetical protein [Thiomargarita sp.]